MSQNYKLDVNGTYVFEKTSDEVQKIDIVTNPDKSFHILKNSASFKAEIESSDLIRKEYTVKVNQGTFKVKISSSLDVLIKELGFEVGASKQVDSVKSPMPGLIFTLDVEVGQEVKEGQNLLILEAMKMENRIASPRDGVIKSIAVGKGDAVDKGQLLIEFE